MWLKCQNNEPHQRGEPEPPSLQGPSVPSEVGLQRGSGLACAAHSQGPAGIAKTTQTDSYSFVLDHRRLLTWLWRAWASTPLVVASFSLLIGYLRTSRSLYPVLDLLEILVGLGFSGFVCLPLIIVACYLHRHTRAGMPASAVPRWLVWVPLAMVMPFSLVIFVTYVFGDLGVAIRTFTTSIFEHV